MLYLSCDTQIERISTVTSITQILDSIKTFSAINFTFSEHIGVFNLLKNIPENVALKLSNDDFIYHLSQAQSHLDWLNDYFKNQIIPPLKKQLKKSTPKDSMIPYADFTVDAPPIFKHEDPVQLSFEDILRNSLEDGRPLTPVKRRGYKPFSFEGNCPHCGAPKDFILDNNGGKGQFACKACKGTFTLKTTTSEQAGIYCPHCGKKLVPHHDRNGYIVYRCLSYKCPYYRNNKRLHEDGKGEHLKTSSDQYRFHYHYREFKFNLDSLQKMEDNLETKVNLSKIHFDSKVLGLVLTYYVNYGLSSRKTALILKEVHGLKISHQTVLNYANTVSVIIKPLVDNYPYKLSSTLCGDETYIKVRGKNHYVFFWSDPKSKIITSYTIYAKRDVECACRSIHDFLRHFNGDIPEDLILITDGNPIYNAAQLFFRLNGINFELHQVIGVKNKDEESALYRPYKQIEERLNRTYKQNYYGTNGYDKLECANSYMILFVAYFNFLRGHSALGYRTPVDDNLFENGMLVQDKWLKMIQLSEQFHQPKSLH